MKECIKCHTMCEDNEKFCHNCGNQFIEVVNNNVRYTDLNDYPNHNRQPEIKKHSEGSLVGGFCLGFLLGIIGLLIALLANNFGSNTKKGAIFGFIIQMILGIILISTGNYPL